MVTLTLLAKVGVVFSVAEKCAYGIIGLYSCFIAKKYVEDYVESVQSEEGDE